MSIIWFSRYFYWLLGNRWLLCAHPLMTSINFILEYPTLKKTSVTYLNFMFQLMIIFRILISWKQLIHTSPFHSWSYILMFLGFLEVCNRVSNLNKAKNIIFVGLKIEICQLEIPIFIYNFISLNSLWISFSYGFYVFNRVTSWNKGKALILVLSSFQISSGNTGFTFKLTFLSSFWIGFLFCKCEFIL